VIDISLILPTRERPLLALRMLESVFATASRPTELEVILYIDRDDRASHEIDHPNLRIVKLICPRAKMGAMTQACYAASSGRYVMLANDDLVCRTSGWDQAIRESFEACADQVALVWGNDLFRGARLPTHPFLSRTACEIMGGICPEAYRRDYIDTHIHDVFCALCRLGHDRRVFLPDLIFEHLHVENGKAEMDNTAIKFRKAEDEMTYIAWAEERRLAAARLARHIESASRLMPSTAWRRDPAIGGCSR
jgi:hypothetical protein